MALPLLAPGVIGGTVSGITALSDLGCSPFGMDLSLPPDAVYGTTRSGVVLYLQGDLGLPGGLTWVSASSGGLGLAGSVIKTGRCSGSVLLIGTDKGLEWTSLLDGSTGLFSTSLSFGGGVSSILPLSGGRVLAGVVGDGSAPGVLICDVPSKSCNGSGSGIPASSQSTLLLQTPGSGAPIIAARSGPGGGGPSLTFSTDGGATWTGGSGLPAGSLSVGALAATPTTTFAATSQGLLKSGDGGATWSAVSGAGAPTVPLVAVAASGNYVLAGVGNSVYRSADGGATWTETPVYGGNDPFNVHGLAATQTQVWAATSGGVSTSFDHGTSWFALNKDLANVGIAKLAATGGSSNVFAATSADSGSVGQAYGLFTSADNGQSWKPGYQFTGVVFSDVALAGSALLAAKTAGGPLFRSTDGGATWTNPSDAVSRVFYSFTSLATTGTTAFGVVANPIYPIALSRTVFVSMDSGATWASTGTAFAAMFPSISPGPAAASGNMIAVAFGAAVARSADGGTTWTAGPSLPPVGPTIQRLVFAGGTLWAADGTGGLWRSGDAGATWGGPAIGIPASASVNDLVPAGAQLLVATSQGVYVSTDGGSTWALLRGDLAGVNATALTISGGNLVVGTLDRSILTFALPVTARRLVPIVLDVAGLGHYTTELSIPNRGTTDAQVSFLYTASLGSGTGTVNDTVTAGSQLHIPDAIAYLRGKGLAIPADGSPQAGTLLLTFTGVSEPSAVSAVARTTAATVPPQPVGSAGLGYLGVDPDFGAAGSLTVYGLRSNGSDRSNLAVYNMSSDPVTYNVTLFSGDGSGSSSVVASSDALPAWGWKQYNRVLDGPGYANGWAMVIRTSATGLLGAYGVINDNVTNDGSFVDATPEGVRLLYLNVPVLAEVSSFRSELTLTNASDSAGTFTLTYTEGISPQSGAGGSVNIPMPAQTQMIIPNVLAYLRTLGVAIGAPGGSAGSLKVEVSGAAPGLIYAGARTASQSPAGGEFGLFTPAVLAGDEAVTVAYLYGLRADANSRSNVAAANTATDPGAGSIVLLFEVFDGNAGGALKGSGTLTLAPGQWGQLNGFLGMHGVSNGWVRVTRTSGTAAWIAYGVVNDGGTPGQRTGDGAYIPMTR